MSQGDSVSVLRQAAQCIQAQRARWDGVGLLVVENQDQCVAGAVLVPSDVPRPSWHARQAEALRTPAAWYGPDDAAPASAATLPCTLPTFETHEELWLVEWLSKWLGTHGAATCHGRWTEFANLLASTGALDCPPAAERQVAVAGGPAGCYLPAGAATPLGAFLAGLVAWLHPVATWTLEDGTRVYGHAPGPQDVHRAWTPVLAWHGNAGRTSAERVAAGGLREWGAVLAWPNVVDCVVAYLLHAAAAPEAKPARRAARASDGKRRPLSKDRRHVVLVAVHEVITSGHAGIARPDKARQESAYRWARDNLDRDVRAEVAGVGTDWAPKWYAEWLCADYPHTLKVADLLDAVPDSDRFRQSVRDGMKEEQRSKPK